MNIVNALIEKTADHLHPEEVVFVQLYDLLNEVTQAFQAVENEQRDLDPALVKTLLAKSAALEREFFLRGEREDV